MLWCELFNSYDLQKKAEGQRAEPQELLNMKKSMNTYMLLFKEHKVFSFTPLRPSGIWGLRSYVHSGRLSTKEGSRDFYTDSKMIP